LVDAVPAWIVVAVSAAIVAGLLAGLVVTL
jgi:hypothetical protein